MTENSENLHMSFLCPIDWHIFFPGGFDNFNANQDTLVFIKSPEVSNLCVHAFRRNPYCHIYMGHIHISRREQNSLHNKAAAHFSLKDMLIFI